MKRISSFSYIIIIASLLLISCSTPPSTIRPWDELPTEHYTIPPHAKYLANFRIVLDPGHGGLAHLPGYKRGPTGQREAVMNLNVALFLKKFLLRAGAKVVMTRTNDRFVSLQERVDISEKVQGDFLISLHHNAAENAKTNYASVFYHLHPDYSPSSLDIARNIYFGLVEALRLPQVAEDGLLTDKLFYPAGFGLLRRLKIPGVLLESSFFTNPKEEKRLIDLNYNQREAYGIFLGLVRWAAGGLPKSQLIHPIQPSISKKPEIIYKLFDGITERGGRGAGKLLAYSNSISLKLDGQPVPVKVNIRRKQLVYQPDSALTNGAHLLQVDLGNLFKNNNLPRIDTLIIASPVRLITFHIPSKKLPADGTAVMPIELILSDKDNQPVWDGTTVQLSTRQGTVFPRSTQLENSRAIVYYKTGLKQETVQIVVTADGRQDTLSLKLVEPGLVRVLSGVIVDDSTEQRLAGAEVLLGDSLSTRSDDNGSFFILNPPTGQVQLSIKSKGYAKDKNLMTITSTKSKIVQARLHANLAGLLHNEVIIIDAALGGIEKGDRFGNNLTSAQANLDLVTRLADSLNWAGAEPILIRANDDTLGVQTRIKKVNALKKGWYLKLNYKQWDSDSVQVECTTYPGNKVGERLAKAIGQPFSKDSKTRVVFNQNINVPEVTYTNKTAIAIVIRSRFPMINRRDLPTLFKGILEFQRKTKEMAANELAGDQ